jgi:hypothetical protein
LLYERNSVEAKYWDHEIRYAPPSREAITGDDITSLVKSVNPWLDDLISLMNKMSDIINNAVALERAFGAPGQEGDPERLAHLAKRWNSVYAEFIDWAASIRGASASSKLQNLLGLLARCADDPVEKYRRLVDEYVAQVDALPAAIAAGEPLRIEVSIVLSKPDDKFIKSYETELNRLKRLESNRLGGKSDRLEEELNLLRDRPDALSWSHSMGIQSPRLTSEGSSGQKLWLSLKGQ